MAGDFAKPVATDAYATLLQLIRDNQADLLTLLEFGDPANLPTGAKRINPSSKAVERWNGTAWVGWASYFPAADMTTAATANKGVLRSATGEITGTRVFGRKDGQGAYNSAGLESGAPTGDVWISLHAEGVSAAALTHIRGGNGIEVRSDTGDLARIKAAPGVAANDVMTVGQLHVGRVLSGGTSAKLPSGWTSSYVTSGQYRVTHNLGSSAYTVVATAIVGGIVASVANRGTTSFDISTRNVIGGAQFDSEINFFLMVG